VRVYLRSNGDFDLDTRFEGNGSLRLIDIEPYSRCVMTGAYNLLDNLARGVEVDETFVDLQLEAVPGLRTFTTRLVPSIELRATEMGT
jgi:hypothetical protein